VQLDKTVHMGLRAKLFSNRISMQELFNEFANMLVTDNRSANAVLDKAIANKLRRAMKSKAQHAVKGRNESFGELESEALYNLINNGGLDEEDGPNPDGEKDDNEAA
jgi:hypothetical protein